jgi:hypothetical protein
MLIFSTPNGMYRFFRRITNNQGRPTIMHEDVPQRNAKLQYTMKEAPPMMEATLKPLWNAPIPREPERVGIHGVAT